MFCACAWISLVISKNVYAYVLTRLQVAVIGKSFVFFLPSALISSLSPCFFLCLQFIFLSKERICLFVFVFRRWLLESLVWLWLMVKRSFSLPYGNWELIIIYLMSCISFVCGRAYDIRLQRVQFICWRWAKST